MNPEHTVIFLEECEARGIVAHPGVIDLGTNETGAVLMNWYFADVPECVFLEEPDLEAAVRAARFRIGLLPIAEPRVSWWRRLVRFVRREEPQRSYNTYIGCMIDRLGVPVDKRLVTRA